MKKYIHYCWFGTKPLPKLAKQCIKSWKKYLPDFEIVKWSEENVNLDECPFVRGAYDNKKWAFVADYFRCKALKEMGGIYFDTDMKVTKNISHLLDNDTFLGIEDSGYVAVGVWYEKNKDAFLPKEMMKKYQSFKEFDIEKMQKISIPIIISDILKNYGFVKGSKKIQLLQNNITIYPRDYFYPYSYARDNNIFTDNTCMIHYYDASWIPLKDRIENSMVRKIGTNKTQKVLNGYRKGKNFIRKTTKVVLFPAVIYRNKKRKNRELKDKNYVSRINETINSLKNNKNSEYVVFYNKEWFGITSATKELFSNLVDCGEIKSKKDAKKIGDAIISNKINQVVFSSMTVGDKDLILYLKRKKGKKIKIKVFWHGSISQVSDEYGWNRNKEIIELLKKKKITTFGICKESMEKFYKNQNLNTKFITNKVDIDFNSESKKENNKEITIGLYAAKCDDWRKNMFTQLAAAALIENAVVDMVPLNESAKEFAKMLNLKIKGLEKAIPREELIRRMAKNDINLYVTYSECSPMLPLESLEVNVPCITGNNHHYFKKSDLEKYLVVDNESDPELIKNKMLLALKDKNKIIKLYKEFSIKNKKNSKKQVEDFLNNEGE